MTVGIVDLGDFTVTTATTTTGTAVTGLDGMTAVTVFPRFAYGTGGTTLRVYFQTSLDQGVTWIDIACVLMGTASEVAVLNFSGLTPKTTAVIPTDGAMADDSAVDGVLGDRLRVKITSTGTYAGSSVLSVRAAVR